MTPAAPGMVVAIRVRDLTASRRFYQALGFLDESGDLASGTTCAALRHRDCGLLLTETGPMPRGQRPLLLGLLVDDVDAIVGALRDGGFDVSGPADPRAPWVRASVPDPEGNTVLIGQAAQHPAYPDTSAEGAMTGRSLFAETAALLAAERLTSNCQVRDVDLRPCAQSAAVKLADSAGESVWACLDHADEILVTVRGAFIASHADPGVWSFLARRRQ